MPPVRIAHYTDILCVWAYVGQTNHDRLLAEFGDQIEIDMHFCSVFPDTWTKIPNTWKDRGGFDGYASHVREVAQRFPDRPVHDHTWSVARPRSSASPHLFVKAVALVETDRAAPAVAHGDRLPVRAAYELRKAFFTRGKDIAIWDVQADVAARIGVDFDDVIDKIKTGEAIAQLAADYDLAQSLRIEGSPTYVLNEGRQKLFGNVSFGVIEANVAELLSGEGGDEASLCS